MTLYTDASFGLSSSWAIYLRSEKGRITKSGKCPQTVDDSNAAEMYAALVGITVAIRDWGPLTGIQINSDSRVVCGSLYPWSPENRHPTIRRIQTEIRRIIKEAGIKIRAKHVRGHQRSVDTRAWINNRCDSMARKARERRDQPVQNSERLNSVFEGAPTVRGKHELEG